MDDIFITEKYLKYLQSYLTTDRLTKINQILQERTQHFTVAIEDVYQMHNASAVMRSCDVFGWQDLHVIEQKFGKKIDSEIAMGSQKWVNVHRHENALNCIQKLKSNGFQIVATVPNGVAISLNDFDISKPSAFFFGTERHGLSEVVLDNADTFMKIPMYGFSESLNISVAASIIIQNLTEKLRKSEISWKLNSYELMKTQILWQRNSIKNIHSIDKVYLERILKK